MLRPVQAPPRVPTGDLRASLGTLSSSSEVGLGARGRGLGCVILCGGLGTRLQSVLGGGRPKSMAEVAGRPFLEWLLLALQRQGVTRVTLATGHLGDRIRERLGNGGGLGMRLTYSQEDTPLGTGGALRLALEQTPGDPILVLNGDTYSRLDLDRLFTAHVENRARATLQLAFVDDAGRYGTVQVTDAGVVTTFTERRGGGPGWVSAGVCVLERSVLTDVTPGSAFSIEADLLPRLANDGLRAVAGSGPFVDIGTPESYAEAADVLDEELAVLVTPAPSTATALVRRRLADSVAVKQHVMAHCAGDIIDAAELIASAYDAGGKLLICGNGGSAGDSQHMAAELMSRLRSDVERRALGAIALTTDTSFLTAFANDYGYDDVFARQVEGLAGPHDVVLGISTSGNSVNVTRALAAAQRIGARTLALTGAGGSMASTADVAVQIPSRNTQLVQECMLSIEHIICELVEDALFGGRDLGGAHEHHGEAA